MGVLEGWYFGNEIPYESFGYSNDPAYKKMAEGAFEREEKLKEGLTEKQKEQLENLMKDRMGLAAMEANRMFFYSFKLAFKLATEIFLE